MQTARTESGGDLVRVLGMVFGLAAVVGGAVGQGILRQPGVVAAAVPDPAIILLLWAAGGAIAAIAAIPYAELGASIPRAGGPYVFVRRAFGPTAGVIIGWSDWLNSLSAQAFMAVVIAEFIQRLGFAASIPQSILAPLLIAVVAALNSTNTRLCGSSQSIGSAVKGAALLLLVTILFLAPSHNAATVPAAPSASANLVLGIGAVIVALRAVQNTYDGWNNCIYFCEEMHAPERCIPRALFGGIALVTFLYLLVNAAMLRILSPAQMAGSKLAAADALSAVIADWAGVALTVFGIISVTAILNLQVMFCSRIAVALGRDHVLPRRLATIALGGSPRIALITSSALSALLSASGTYEELIAMNVALGALTNGIVALAAWRMRHTEPKLRRPFQTPLFPWPILAAALINAALLIGLIYDDPFHSLFGTGLACAIGATYWMMGELRRRLGVRTALLHPNRFRT